MKKEKILKDIKEDLEYIDKYNEEERTHHIEITLNKISQSLDDYGNQIRQEEENKFRKILNSGKSLYEMGRKETLEECLKIINYSIDKTDAYMEINKLLKLK